jgi:hypothetical protein
MGHSLTSNGGQFDAKTRLPNDSVYHCWRVFGKVGLFKLGIAVEVTASPRTPKQWHTESRYCHSEEHSEEQGLSCFSRSITDLT